MAQHNDPLSGARYPDDNEPASIAQFIQNAVNDLSSRVIPRFATSSARTTAYANWVAAGNTMVSGLTCFTQSDGRYWRYDTASSSWLYMGGNTPPIVAVSAGAGWNPGSRAPGAYKDSSGLVHLCGFVTPASTYNSQDGGTHTAFQLPTGYRPGANFDVIIPVIFSGGAYVELEIRTDGIGYIVGGSSATISSGLQHPLDSITFHPSYTGSVPLA